MKNFSWLLMGAALTAACSPSMETRVEEKFPDRPPAFREGYVDGCSSGKAEAARAARADVGTKNLDENIGGDNVAKTEKMEARKESDKDYANGWYDGHETCKDNYSPSPADDRHDSTKPVRVEGGY